MKYKKAIMVLSKELCQIAGLVFAEFATRQLGTDEQKKSLEANDFLMGLMNGKIKKEWKLEESENYTKMMEINQAINYLSEVE